MGCGQIAELSCAFAMFWQLWLCVLARGGTSSWGGGISGSVVVHIVFCVYFCGFMRVWFAVMFSPCAVVSNYSLCLC